jgi:hypothetical protein
MNFKSILIARVAIALAAGLTAAPAFASEGERGGRMGEMLRRMDTNQDGTITRVEADAMRTQMFARIDTNSDGFIDIATEGAAVRGEGGRGGRGGERPNLDTNNDGKISRPEFMADNQMFNRLDTNRDGQITRAELEAMRGQRPSR